MKHRRLLRLLREQYLYSDVEKYAKPQPEVEAAIKRFRALPEEQKAKTPLLYWLLGAGTPPYKMSKEDSKYSDISPHADRVCANCEFQYIKTANGHYICSQISGRIRPEGWCKLWKSIQR